MERLGQLELRGTEVASVLRVVLHRPKNQIRPVSLTSSPRGSRLQAPAPPQSPSWCFGSSGEHPPPPGANPCPVQQPQHPLFLSSSMEPNSLLSSLVPAPSSPSKPDTVTPAPAASSSQRRSICVSAHWWTFDCADAEKTKRSLVQGDRGTTSCNAVHALRGHRFVFRRRAIWRQPRHCQLTSASS